MDEPIVEFTFSLEEITAQFLQLIPQLIAALVVFFLGLLLTNLITRLVQRSLQYRKVNAEVTLALTRITQISLLVFTITAALQQVGFNLTAFLAGLGIAGFTIGFALQDVSKNFIAGMLLLIQQPFQVGDAIQVGEFEGNVTEIHFRDTVIRTFDGRIVHIPNGDVFTSPIVNYSQADSRRLELNVGVAKQSDLESVRQVALQAIQGLPGILSDPASQVVFHTFGSSSVDMTLFYWIDTSQVDLMFARDIVTEAIKRAFEGAGIEIPYPISVVQNV